MVRNQDRCGPESYRETVVDVLGAGFSHAGICQVHLVKYDRLEKRPRHQSQCGAKAPWPMHSPSSPAKHPQTPKRLKTWAPDNYTNTNCVHGCLLLTRAQSSKVELSVFFKPGVHEWLHSWRKTKQNKKPLWFLYLFFVISISLLYVKYPLTWSLPEGAGFRGSSVLPARITLRGKGPG